MRIIYVTAAMPYGKAETFIIGEIAELLREHEVLIVPRSPRELGQHARWLGTYTARTGLFSVPVLAGALAVAITRPRLAARCLKIVLKSSGVRMILRNLAVFPKGLWMGALASQRQVDHIHCHWAGTTATMAMIASIVSGIPWSLTAHRSDIVSSNLLREKARSATAIRTIAREGRRMMIERGVDPSDKLLVLPMGVHIPERPTPATPKDQVILCPADLLPVKGHKYLLEAWAQVRGRGIKATLWLAGSGELASELRNQAAQLGLGDSVVFLGTVNHSDLLDMYKDGRVAGVVLASVDLGGGVHEGIPVALVEAMSYGVPVVATSTGGIPELVRPGTGILVPERNSDALAQALQNLLQQPAATRLMGLSGRSWVAASRNIRHVTASLVAIFKSGLSTPAGFAETVTAVRDAQWRPARAKRASMNL